MHSIKALDLSNLILVYRTMPRRRRRGRRGWGRPRLRGIGRGVAVEGPPREGSEVRSVTVTPPPALPPVALPPLVPPLQAEPPPQPALPPQATPEVAPPAPGVDANTKLMCESIQALIQTLVTTQQANLLASQHAQAQAQAHAQAQAKVDAQASAPVNPPQPIRCSNWIKDFKRYDPRPFAGFLENPIEAQMWIAVVETTF